MGQMGTKFPDFFAELGAPFFGNEVKTRSQAGRTFDYVTARTVMNRLDNVAGPEGWWDRYRTGSDNSVICALTVVLPDGTQLTKEDTGGHAGMADGGDDDKSAFSDALKRSAVKFGVGRFLYRDGTPEFVAERKGLTGYGVPANQDVALAGGAPAPEYQSQDAPVPRPQPQRQPDRQDAAPAPQNGNGDRPAYNGPQRAPTSGKSLFAWAKDMEQKHEVGMLKWLTQYGKLQNFPDRMIDWQPADVAIAYGEAVKKLPAAAQPPAAPSPAPSRAPATVPPDRGDSYEDDGDESIPF